MTINDLLIIQNLCGIIKTMSALGHQYNDFVATHTLEDLASVHHVQVHELPQNYCGYNGEGT